MARNSQKWPLQEKLRPLPLPSDPYTRFRAAYKVALERRGEPKVVILIRESTVVEGGDRIPQISFRFSVISPSFPFLFNDRSRGEVSPNSLTDRSKEKENFSLKIDLSRKILSNFNNRSQIYNTQFFFSFLLLGTESEVDFLNFHFSKSRTGKFLLSIDAFQSTGMNKEKERERKPRVAVHSNRIASEPVSISKPDNFAITVRSFFLPFPFMYVRETCAQKEKGDLSRRSSVLYQGRNYAAPF